MVIGESVLIDINLIGIGAITGALVVAGTNLYIFNKNRKNDQVKEQLKNLYNPLNAQIEKKFHYLTFLKMRAVTGDVQFEQFASEYYELFLSLRDIYLENEVFGSLKLQRAYHSLSHYHEVEYYNAYKDNLSEENIIKKVAIFEMQHNPNSDGLSEFEQKLEQFIEIVKEDIYQIYQQKPVFRFYK